MAIKGIDLLIKINTGTADLPEYTAVGAQRGASLSLEGETLDKTSKDSEGWTENLAGFKSWSISTDGLLILDDKGYMAIEEAFINGDNIMVEMSTKTGSLFEGDAVISSVELDAPYDDLATYTAEFTGSGKLEKKE